MTNMAGKLSSHNYLLALIFVMQCATFLNSSYAAYNVVEFGAKADGWTDSTLAFQRAWWAACYKSSRPTTLYVPGGDFLVKPIVFNGPCRSRVFVRIDGKIIAPSDYWSMGNSGYWILFYKVTGLTIYGGTLDARGSSFWKCRKSASNCPPGARSISFVGSGDIMITGLTSINSETMHIAIHQSYNIVMRNVRTIAPGLSPNTDGVHIQESTGITILDSVFRTGDDCISIGDGSKNIWIQRVACGPGHGISIGSLAGANHNEYGVQNVTVTGAIFTKTQNGVRIKSWARRSTGFAKDITFKNIVMRNVYNPIIIDQKYCPSGNGCPIQESGVKISGVRYENIRGTSASNVAVNYVCSGSNPCWGLTLRNVKLTSAARNTNTAPITSSCTNAYGSTQGYVFPPGCFT